MQRNISRLGSKETVMKTCFKASLAFIILLLSVSALSAETVGRFSLSAFIGASQDIELGNLVPVPEARDLPPVKFLRESKFPELGVRLGYELDRRFRLQFGIDLARTEIMEDIGIGFAGIPLGKKKLSSAVAWSLVTRVLYNLSSGAIDPYLFAGGGVAVLDTETIGSQTRLTVEFGAGLKAKLSERWGAFLEVRDVIGFMKFFEDFKGVNPSDLIYTAKSRGIQHSPGVLMGIEFLF